MGQSIVFGSETSKKVLSIVFGTTTNHPNKIKYVSKKKLKLKQKKITQKRFFDHANWRLPYHGVLQTLAYRAVSQGFYIFQFIVFVISFFFETHALCLFVFFFAN